MLDLRPLTIGQLFDRAFRLYRNNFLTFLGIVALTQIPLYIFQIILTTSVSSASGLDPTNPLELFQGPALILSIITFILSIIFTQIGAAALTKAISDSYLGRTISIKETFQRLGRSWFILISSLLWAGLVFLGIAIPLMVVFIIPCIGQIVGVIGIFALAIVGNVIVSLIPPVVVLENSGARDAVKRAWELGRKRFWWIFGYLFLLGLLFSLVVQGPVFLITFLFETVLGNTSLLIQNIISQSATLALTAFFLPIRLAAITLMYFDLRIRFEGFDLMVLASGDQDIPSDAADLTTKRSL
ncbi:MAG: hypothetical protein GY805_03430 [Chloroflexi bacterium]|nr:hypothetical protein [Chloroflexota bacterium]